MSLILEFISTFLITIIQVFCWYKMLDTIRYPKKIFLIGIIILSLISLINYNINNSYLKIISIMIVAVLFCKLFFKQQIKNCLVVVTITEIFVILLDGLFGIIIFIIFNENSMDLLERFGGTFIADIVISISIFLLAYYNILTILYNNIFKFMKKIAFYQILILSIIIILCSSLAFAITYYNKNIYISMIFNFVIIILYFIIIMFILKLKNKNQLISERYNNMINNLQVQEEMISECRICNHESKNQLRTIKNMTNNKKIISYIESILKEKTYLNNIVINEVYRIPSGGLRGLIYNKIVDMKQKNINYSLVVDRKVNQKLINLIKIDDIIEICKLLGIFIDNAIEESLNNSKKQIDISLYVIDDEFILDISNIYNKNYMDKTFKSRKGINRGFGLKLAKRIVMNNDNIIHNTLIKEDIFQQRIIYKILK